MPRVSVIIPTWNGWALLEPALESLERQTYRDFEVIVVDNGSTDGTEEHLARRFPDVRLIRFPENRGFAPAVNAGISEGRGEFIVLMNNDTEAEPGWIGALVRALDEHPEVGSCASRMLDFYDRSRIDAAGDRLGIMASQIGHGMPDGPEFDVPRYVLSACAGASAYRRSALDDVGLFDERFFAYMEDVDLGVRLQFAGYRCLYVPDAVIYHKGSATASRIAGRRFYLLMRNSLFVFFQYMPLRRLLLWGPAILAVPVLLSVLRRQPLHLAFRALADFVRDLPTVIRRRRQVIRNRRIPWSEFRSLLAGPFALQGRHRPTTRRATREAAHA